MSKNLKLLSSFKLGKLELPNRVVFAPLTRGRAGVERIPNQLMAKYYAQRASAGLLISEATTISLQGRGWVESAAIYNDQQTEGWQQVVKAVHQAGGRIFLQLWHTGRASHSSFFEDGSLPVAPSAIAIEGQPRNTPKGQLDSEIPRALETDEIPQVVEDYKQASKRALDAGFDGVEIHAANGYLIDQFLQSCSNKREDQYCGSIENRYRFLAEVTEAVKQVWPADKIGVRLSPNGVFNGMGSADFRETFLYAVKELDRHGLAYLHFLDGLAFGFHNHGEPMTLAEFRKVCKTPLMGNCGYTCETAEQAIASGDADLISFGRAYISNPDLVERFANDWPLADVPDMSVWYSGGEKGYADFPNYQS